MARIRGQQKTGINIEPTYAAPLDARTIVETLADLYDKNNWQYAYKGMRVTVTSDPNALNNGIYYLSNPDYIDSSVGWVKSSTGGGGGSAGGLTISASLGDSRKDQSAVNEDGTIKTYMVDDSDAVQAALDNAASQGLALVIDVDIYLRRKIFLTTSIEIANGATVYLCPDKASNGTLWGGFVMHRFELPKVCQHGQNNLAICFTKNNQQHYFDLDGNELSSACEIYNADNVQWDFAQQPENRYFKHSATTITQNNNKNILSSKFLRFRVRADKDAAWGSWCYPEMNNFNSIEGKHLSTEYKTILDNLVISGTGTIMAQKQNEQVEKTSSEPTYPYSDVMITIDGGRYFKVVNVKLESQIYTNSCGIGVRLIAASGNVAYNEVSNVALNYFEKGVSLERWKTCGSDTFLFGEFKYTVEDGETLYWNNANTINVQSTYCSRAVDFYDSGFNNVTIFGESGHVTEYVGDTTYVDIDEVEVKAVDPIFGKIYPKDNSYNFNCIDSIKYLTMETVKYKNINWNSGNPQQDGYIPIEKKRFYSNYQLSYNTEKGYSRTELNEYVLFDDESAIPKARYVGVPVPALFVDTVAEDAILPLKYEQIYEFDGYWYIKEENRYEATRLVYSKCNPEEVKTVSSVDTDNKKYTDANGTYDMTLGTIYQRSSDNNYFYYFQRADNSAVVLKLSPNIQEIKTRDLIKAKDYEDTYPEIKFYTRDAGESISETASDTWFAVKESLQDNIMYRIWIKKAQNEPDYYFCGGYRSTTIVYTSGEINSVSVVDFEEQSKQIAYIQNRDSLVLEEYSTDRHQRYTKLQLDNALRAQKAQNIYLINNEPYYLYESSGNLSFYLVYKKDGDYSVVSQRFDGVVYDGDEITERVVQSDVAGVQGIYELKLQFFSKEDQQWISPKKGTLYKLNASSYYEWSSTDNRIKRYSPYSTSKEYRKPTLIAAVRAVICGDYIDSINVVNYQTDLNNIEDKTLPYMVRGVGIFEYDTTTSKWEQKQAVYKTWPITETSSTVKKENYWRYRQLANDSEVFLRKSGAEQNVIKIILVDTGNPVHNQYSLGTDISAKNNSIYDTFVNQNKTGGSSSNIFYPKKQEVTRPIKGLYDSLAYIAEYSHDEDALEGFYSTTAKDKLGTAPNYSDSTYSYKFIYRDESGVVHDRDKSYGGFEPINDDKITTGLFDFPKIDNLDAKDRFFSGVDSLCLKYGATRASNSNYADYGLFPNNINPDLPDAHRKKNINSGFEITFKNISPQNILLPEFLSNNYEPVEIEGMYFGELPVLEQIESLPADTEAVRLTDQLYSSSMTEEFDGYWFKWTDGSYEDKDKNKFYITNGTYYEISGKYYKCKLEITEETEWRSISLSNGLIHISSYFGFSERTGLNGMKLRFWGSASSTRGYQQYFYLQSLSGTPYNYASQEDGIYNSLEGYMKKLGFVQQERGS